MMTYESSEPQHTMSLIAADHAEIVSALAVALVVGLDESLQGQLRKLARVSDGQSFMVSQLGSRVWLKLGDGSGVTVHRKRLDELATVDFDLALASDPNLPEALKRALSRTTARADASNLLDPLWEMRAMPSREQFAALRQWSPLLEQMAYKSSVRLSILLDVLRPEIRGNLIGDKEHADPGMYLYWSGLHIMAHLSLLASEAEAGPWLNDIASQFKWSTWTPTFPLLRERTAWLGACAARSAIAFGEPIIGQYLAALTEAQHPMKAFDALFGLVAIALGCEATSAAILSEVRSMREVLVYDSSVYSEYFEMVYDDAIRTISQGEFVDQTTDIEIRNLHWQRQSREGLSTREALCTDPASFSVPGRFVGFSMLPTVVSTKLEEHYSTSATLWRDLYVSEKDIASIIRRAWVPNLREAASHILQ